jgi:hypothetical protein
VSLVPYIYCSTYIAGAGVGGYVVGKNVGSPGSGVGAGVGVGFVHP